MSLASRLKHERIGRRMKPGENKWQNTEFVREWIRDIESRPKSYKDGLRKRHEAVLASIPHARDRAIEILDLGAGWGRLARMLLDEFPAARLTAADFSEPMLDEARRRLCDAGERVRLLQFDMDIPGAIAELGARYDAIVSTMALHHLRGERIARLYEEIHKALRPGGVFVNLDNFRRSRALHARIARRFTRMAWRIALDTPLGGPVERIEAWSYEPDRRARSVAGPGAPLPDATVWEHLDMMRGAGFETRWAVAGPCAIVTGTKRLAGQPS